MIIYDRLGEPALSIENGIITALKNCVVVFPDLEVEEIGENFYKVNPMGTGECDVKKVFEFDTEVYEIRRIPQADQIQEKE